MAHSRSMADHNRMVHLARDDFRDGENDWDSIEKACDAFQIHERGRVDAALRKLQAEGPGFTRAHVYTFFAEWFTVAAEYMHRTAKMSSLDAEERAAAAGLARRCETIARRCERKRG